MITQTQKYLLHFANDNTSSTTRILSLSGSLDFGNVEVGQSADVTLTISNLGNDTLSVSAIALPTGITADWTSGTVATSASQNITLTYTPSTAETLSDSLVVSSDATSGIAAATLTGKAIMPIVDTTDADAAAYFSAVENTGATLSQTQMDAFNTFVVACKSAGVWANIDALYPLMGGTAAAHAINAKGPGSYNITWYGSLSHHALGITGDGSTGYAHTSIIPASLFSQASPDAALSLYSRTHETTSSTYLQDMGLEESWANSLLRLCFQENSTTPAFFDVYSRSLPTSSISGPSVINTTGLLLGNRYADTITLYHDDTLLQTQAITNNDIGDIPSNGDIKLCHINGGYCAKNYTFFHIGKGMNATQTDAFIAAVEQLQTSLGRNV